jgi:hypothetical protein
MQTKGAGTTERTNTSVTIYNCRTQNWLVLKYRLMSDEIAQKEEHSVLCGELSYVV